MNNVITDYDLMVYNQKYEEKIEENYLTEELSNLIEKTKLNTNDLWENSRFKDLRNMTPDQRGSFGEEWIVTLIKRHTNFEVEWDGNKNTSNEDGIYDAKINNKRDEIKTATTGFDSKKNKLTYKFQHENIYEENVWDRLIFLDIEPKGFYLTIIKYCDMPFWDKIHPIFKTKSTRHLSGWKFDTSKKTLQRGINGGITIYININKINKKEITDFLIKHLK